MSREKQDSAYDMLVFRVVHVLNNCLLRVMPPVEQHGKRRSVRIPSQTDREPRAPSKILRSLRGRSRCLFFEGLCLQRAAGYSGYPEVATCGIYLCRIVFSSQLIVGFLKQTFYCLILAGQRGPRDGHREMKFAGLRLVLLEPPIDNLPRY